MSHAPRPCTAPSAIRGTNGSPSQSDRSPGGTTSVWPDRTRAGRPSSAEGTVPTTPHASLRSTSWPGAPASVAAAARSIGQASTAQPRSCSHSARRCCTSLSAEVPPIEGTATIRRSRSTSQPSSTAVRTRASAPVRSAMRGVWHATCAVLRGRGANLTVVTQPPPPPGWYPDPAGSGGTRWWNGMDWTDHVQQAAPVPPPPPPPPPAPMPPSPPPPPPPSRHRSTPRSHPRRRPLRLRRRPRLSSRPVGRSTGRAPRSTTSRSWW